MGVEQVVRSDDPQHAAEVGPVVFAHVGLLEPGVGIGGVVGAAIIEIIRQDVAERAINVAGGISRQPMLGPIAVDHFIRDVHSAVSLWAVVGEVGVIDAHLHGARISATEA